MTLDESGTTKISWSGMEMGGRRVMEQRDTTTKGKESNRYTENGKSTWN